MVLEWSGELRRVATVLAVLVVSGCASSSGHQVVEQPHSGASRATSAISGLVPWIDAAPPPYRPPAMSTPPTPPANARPCRSVDVSASFASGNGAGGHSVTYVQFRNASNSMCLLAGYPDVTGTEPGRPDVVGTRGSFFPSGHSADMRPGSGITLLGLESDTYCAARPGGGGGGDNYHHFTLTLPGGGMVSLTLPGSGIDLTCGLHLTGFFDPDYPQPAPVYPLAALRATLALPQTAQAGQTLDYEVHLHNPTTHAIGLKPCPAYVEAASSPVPVKMFYALNCTPVVSIAPGRTIRFAMQLPVPTGTPAGPLRIVWDLRSPDVMATGTVRITR